MGFFWSWRVAPRVMKPPFDIAADLDTPVSAYLKLAPFRPRFLLESVEGGERLARYSFIGFGECLEVRLDAVGTARRRAALARGRARGRNSSTRCAARSRTRLSRNRRLPGVPLSGGLVGYTAYDAVRYFERLPGRSLDDDRDAARPLCRAALAVGLRSSDPHRRASARRQRGGAPEPAPRGHARAARRGADHARAPGAFRPRRPRSAESAHAAGVQRAQEYIASGDVYQLVLASRFEGRHALAPFEVYRALRLLNPSPYMFFCELGDITVVGSSPEALVKSHGGHAQLRPIAGSRPRGADAAADAEARGGSARGSRRRTPSTSCWWISRATIWAASRPPDRSAWTRTG